MGHPKILLLDIETSPDLAYVWRVYDSNAIEIKEHWRILSFAAEWYHSPRGAQVLGLDDFGGYSRESSESKLLERLYDLLDEADIVVAHNGDRFDIRKINARFLRWGFAPPTPYKTVDTKKETARVFGFSSNKLDWLSKQLDLGKKLQHYGFEMWTGCMADDPKWWKIMKQYNAHDVKLLRKLYKLTSPWIRQPNAGMWTDGNVCPNPTCGSTNLKRNGYQRNKTRSYWRYKCKSCGKPSRSTKMVGKTERVEIG